MGEKRRGRSVAAGATPGAGPANAVDSRARLDHGRPVTTSRPDLSSLRVRPWRPWVTLAILAANLAMFGVELASGVSPLAPTPSGILDLGGNFAPLTLGGEPWRIVTAMFLHYGLLHLAMNMLALWQGRVVERLFGAGAFLAIYLTAGLAGGVATLLRPEPAVSAGASGAVFGVFGAFGAFLLLHRERLADDAWRRTAGSLATFLGVNLVFGLMTPGIDMGAHVGGLIGGALAAFVIARAWRRTGRASRLGRAVPALVLVAAAGLTVAAVAALPQRANVSDLVARAGQVETRALADFTAAAEEAKAGRLSDAAFADRVEHDILPPWRAMSDELARAVPEAPTRLGDVLSKFSGYFVARAEAWQVLVALLRGDGSLEEPFKVAWAHAERMGQATVDAMNELQHTGR